MSTTQRDMFDPQVRMEDQLIDMKADTGTVNRQHRVTLYRNETQYNVFVKTNTGTYQFVRPGETATAPSGEHYTKIQYPSTGWKNI